MHAAKRQAKTNVNQSERHLQQEYDDWAKVVGRAVLFFAELELITYKCLEQLPSDRISKTTFGLRFGQRVDLIVEILEGRTPQLEAIAEFLKMLKRAKELSQTRNDLAHNPVMLGIFASDVSEELRAQWSIFNERKNRYIDLAAGKEFAAAVESLAGQMWFQLGKLSSNEQAH